MVDLFVQWNLNPGLMMNTRRSKLESKKELVSTVSSNCDLEDVEILIISEDGKQGLYVLP